MAVGGIPQRGLPDRGWPDRGFPAAPAAGGGGGGDDDTQVMSTREGLTDPSWFGFFLIFNLFIGEKRWQ
jgi:hypothetical protein